MHSTTELGKLLILSPHLDDAVFACGELLARKNDALLLTLFAGLPPPAFPLTEWDAASGFASTAEAVAQRREEDRRALSLLQAHPVWLDFLDSQYGEPPSALKLAGAIATVIEREDPSSVMLPAGLFHTDHILAHEAALLVRKDHPEINWLLYEDTMYRRIPTQLQQRLSELEQEGIAATPVAFDTHAQAERKRHAVQCYASQLRALATPGRPGHGDIFAPEGYWQLSSNDTFH